MENHSEKNYKQLPVYKKAMEIVDIVDGIVTIVFKSDKKETKINDFSFKIIEETAKQMFQNAIILPAKIAAAEGGDTYDIRMQNAAIIRKAGLELITEAHAFELFNYKEVEYLELLIDEVDNFRILFAEWVKTFNPNNHIIDHWGLFNPPSIDYNDHDTDDDIPFN